MELRQAVFSICLLFPLVIMAQFFQPSQSSQSSPTASIACGLEYIAGCLSTAIIAVCGNVSATACACGKSGQGVVASLVGPCLLAKCPVTEILAIGNYATSACDQWLSTHTLTATAGAGGPASTTFSSVTTSSRADMSITSSPSIPSSSPTSTSTGTASQGLPVGAGVGVGVGALAILCVIVALAVFCLRRRRSERQLSQEAYELQTGPNISELPDKASELEEANVVEIPRQELEAFNFPFQEQQIAPVEADSHVIRAQSRGRVAGTETTAFDFESQKVLLTPEFRDRSLASSRAAGSSPASLRRHNTDT